MQEGTFGKREWPGVSPAAGKRVMRGQATGKDRACGGLWQVWFQCSGKEEKVKVTGDKA